MIRSCALELWREDGALEGCEDEYWRLAKTMIESKTKGKVLGRAVARANRDKRVPDLRLCVSMQ
ncbi:DUF2934 domain-containing protein [Caballeronia sordidicola]|uniref:DUF2934 domain-containing protein n=1 Tax=Caballeronia sordidicola TaxID=196367 RepID=UPI000A38F0FF|nr:DUF2934 domain-containing protein [Caballeronia sordidicola]